MRRSVVTPVLALVLLAGCVRTVGPLVQPGTSAVALSGGPDHSMVYVARTDSGVLAIDLGWWGGTRAVGAALRELGVAPAGVTDVFLTHSHRDHVGSWRLVRGAAFHLAAGEVAAFTGGRHRGVIPRWAERLKRTDLPRPGEVRIVAFTRDTAFVFGPDTLRAYLVPGHTAGSAAYLFRGTLFVGDAASASVWGRFTPARWIYSDSRKRARESVRALWARLPTEQVRTVCTAHAHCAPFTAALRERVAR